MTSVDVCEVGIRLARLLERVAVGDEIIITRAGEPVAKLVGYREERKGPRVSGTDKGKIWMSEDFDEFTPELEQDFFGKDDL